MIGENVTKAFDEIGGNTNSECFAELIAAMCYDAM